MAPLPVLKMTKVKLTDKEIVALRYLKTHSDGIYYTLGSRFIRVENIDFDNQAYECTKDDLPFEVTDALLGEYR